MLDEVKAEYNLTGMDTPEIVAVSKFCTRVVEKTQQQEVAEDLYHKCVHTPTMDAQIRAVYSKGATTEAGAFL